MNQKEQLRKLYEMGKDLIARGQMLVDMSEVSDKNDGEMERESDDSGEYDKKSMLASKLRKKYATD